MNEDDSPVSHSGIEFFDSFAHDLPLPLFNASQFECFDHLGDLISNNLYWSFWMPSYPQIITHGTLARPIRRLPAYSKDYLTPHTELPKTPSKPFNRLYDPHYLITVVRSAGFAQDTQFYITADGLLNSPKNTKIEDIMIGRQGLAVDGRCCPNDIVLSENDKQISRIHCKLITQPEFHEFNKVPPQFYQFLSTQWAKSLPFGLLKLVLHFIKHAPLIRVQDVCSATGTLIKLCYNKGRPIEVNNQFLIGAETRFSIMSMRTKNNIQQSADQYDKWISDMKNSYSGLQIKGRMNFTNGPIEQRPFMVLKIGQQHYLLQADPDDKVSTFRIGRNLDSDIYITINTISRRQCRVTFEPMINKWLIFDGDQDKESSNGSWLEMKSTDERNSPIHSFENSVEIKVSESILRVEIVNFNRSRQRQSNYDIIQLLE